MMTKQEAEKRPAPYRPAPSRPEPYRPSRLGRLRSCDHLFHGTLRTRESVVLVVVIAFDFDFDFRGS